METRNDSKTVNVRGKVVASTGMVGRRRCRRETIEGKEARRPTGKEKLERMSTKENKSNIIMPDDQQVKNKYELEEDCKAFEGRRL